MSRPVPARGHMPFPGHRTCARWGTALTKTAREAMMMQMPRVERTPCPRCGVRGDIGCKHSARLG